MGVKLIHSSIMERKEFLKLMGLGALVTAGAMDVKSWAKELNSVNESDIKMPVLFCGHGSPMNAIEENNFTRAMTKLGKELPHPKAILMVSAHWLTKGTFVNGSEKPKMIYDCYGFPEDLYKFNYPAPGMPDVAKEVQALLRNTEVKWDTEWGFDHGNWALLASLYPNATIPVFQLSIDYHKPYQYHFDIAKELYSLRKKGVLIIGSGNITHNLGRLDFSNSKPFDWAIEFDDYVKNAINSNNSQAIINFDKNRVAKLAHPEPSHYLPLIYSMGLKDEKDAISYPYEEMVMGSISMRCVKIG